MDPAAIVVHCEEIVVVVAVCYTKEIVVVSLSGLIGKGGVRAGLLVTFLRVDSLSASLPESGSNSPHS